VRPEEVGPGTRFKWAPGCERDDQLDDINMVRRVNNVSVHFTCESDGDPDVYSFTYRDRIIPIPQEQ
jgi:hypothetical protein